MSFYRTVAALFLALFWGSVALHCELESVGWMLDHDHHGAAAASDTSQESSDSTDSPAMGESHAPLWARNLVKCLRVDTVAMFLLATWVALELVRWGMVLRRLPQDVRAPSGEDPPFAVAWQFAWRCAPDSAAPPALN